MPPPVPVKSVLILEDDDEAGEALERIIRTKSVTVTRFPRVSEALAMLAKDGCPEMVLLDLALQDGSGVDFLKALREKMCLSRVVVMTGLDSGAVDTAKVWQYHVEAVLPKPVSLAVLFFLLGL